MKKIFENIRTKFIQTKMRKQMVIMYFTAVFVPICIVGIILVSGNIKRLNRYHQGLLETNNDRVRAVVYEITSQMYSISEEIVSADELITALSEEYASPADFAQAVSQFNSLEYYTRNYTGIDRVEIYSSQKNSCNTTLFKNADEDVLKTNWYETASDNFSVFWYTIASNDEYGNEYWNLSLVRKIPLYGTNENAVLVIKVSDNYLKSRVEDFNNSILLALNDRRVFYSNNRSDYGRKDVLNVIDYSARYFKYSGEINYGGKSYMADISTLSMPQSDCKMYVVTMNDTASKSVREITLITLVIILIAIIFPGVLMQMFITSFNNQVNDLRDEMSKASNEKYNLLESFEACYEFKSIYNDLLHMVDNIKKKDALEYSREIAEKELLNEQQKMEFQMLASQINPHFLYNTLEMIRMKAITTGDYETATAIKLLGKSMRYVLDNTGTEYTTLAKEMSHIETYLQIQKFRFGDRVNYNLIVDDNLNLKDIRILPLLLQPIVENAILHGLEEVEEGGLITVHIYKETYKKVRIDISDNGCGMGVDTLEDMRENLKKGTINDRYGIGLFNINQRIKICYGTEYGLEIDSILGKGTVVSATIEYICNF